MRGNEYYDIALSREYPFSDSATMLDDIGKRLPEGLLCDLSCAIDQSIANEIFVSGITKKDDFCSIVLSAVNAEKTALGLISGSIADGIDFTYSQTPQRLITPLVSGFQGTAVLGDQWNLIENGSWIFSEPISSRIIPRCCFPIAVPGSQTAAVSYSQAVLQELVTLQAEGDIDLSIQERTLDGRTRRALVIGLSQTSNDILRNYAGNMQRRPESRNCGDPLPIETISGVGPDCCGRVFIELRGCAEPIPITGHCGVVLDCPLTLADICPEEINYADTDNPDDCLFGGADNVLQSAEDQPDSPTVPPSY